MRASASQVKPFGKFSADDAGPCVGRLRESIMGPYQRGVGRPHLKECMITTALRKCIK